MRGLRCWMVAALLVGLAAMVGCEDQKYSKANYEALNAHNKRLEQQNETLRAEFDALKTKKAAETPTVVEAAPTTPTKTAPTLADIKAQLPPGTRVVERDGKTVITIDGAQINFGSGKAGVSPSGRHVLDRVARILNDSLPRRQVIVEGHTDTDRIKKTAHLYKDNYDLGRKRAQNVADYLASRGVDRSRIRTESYGPDRPVSRVKSQNRRVEVVVQGESW